MHYEQAIRELVRFKNALPDIVGSELVGFSLDNIRDQGYGGRLWPPRKEGAPRNLGRGLLIDSGDGRRSLRYVKVLPYVLLEAVDYMVAHNEGARIRGRFRVRSHSRRARGRTVKVRAHQRVVDFTLPERRFAGDHPLLTQRIKKQFNNRLKRITR